MTETRKCFENLILLYDSLCRIEENEIIKFVKLKNSLFVALTEIENYKLLEIDLPKKCIQIASSEDCNDLRNEQSILVVNLLDQLSSLLVGRLWYGGELMYHLNRLLISSYRLPDSIIDEINLIESKKDDEMKLQIRLKKNESKTDLIEKLEIENTQQLASTKEKYKKLDDETFSCLYIQLKEKIGRYRSYINNHYSSISDHFGYNKKLIKAYLCDERKDLIVCRIQSYLSQTDNSINMNSYINDFVPRPPYNFEKINAPLSTWSWFAVYKSDWMISENSFSVDSIHFELLGIFLNHADELELVSFVSFLFRCSNQKVEVDNTNPTYLLITDEAVKKYIKVFHQHEIDTSEFDRTIEKLSTQNIEYERQVIFISKPDSSILKTFEENQIRTLFLYNLTSPHFQNKNSELIHLYVKSRLDVINFGKPNEIGQGRILIKELENCPLGKEGWSKFENIGTEIFKFLFSDSFTELIYETQSSNEENTLRRDLIIHNNFVSSTSFWSRINTDYQAKILIIEFKNYSDELDYETMYSTTKYLRNKSGNFVLIFSRKGAKQKLLNQQKEMLHEGKLILSFDERELIEMIEEKISGRNPLYRLELKHFALLKK